MKQYFSTLQNTDFRGRASRAEFWPFFLANLLVAGALAGAARLASGRPDGLTRHLAPVSSGPAISAEAVVVILGVLYLLVVIIPTAAAAIRRLHDTGRSGAYLFLWFVPFGPIALLFLFAGPSQAGGNQYGPGAGVPSGG